MIGLGTLVGLLAPWPFAIVVDSVLGNKPLPGPLGFLEGLNQYELLAVAVVGGLLLTATAHGLTVAEEYVNTKLEQHMVLDLRSKLFRHAHRLSLRLPRQQRHGHAHVSRSTQAGAVGAITVAIPPLAESVLTLVGHVRRSRTRSTRSSRCSR